MLRCVFPDLKHKPTLSKPIKNFEPDTGLASIGTLIEYKFISRPEQVGSIADQILADTRGYVHPEWRSFVYVIYETQRIKPEAEWSLLLTSSGVTENTSVIVLSGEPASAAPMDDEGPRPTQKRKVEREKTMAKKGKGGKNVKKPKANKAKKAAQAQ